jgi:glycogen phosphorylase
VQAGRHDIERAAAGLARRLPDRLRVFAHLAYNYRWSWAPDGPDLFRAIDLKRWLTTAGNPVRLLQEASFEALERAASDDALIGRAEEIKRIVDEDLARPAGTEATTEDRPIAYFCAEYALHRSLPIYSGGLGALAGDHLKEASDYALPLVAVGLMYHRGYFRQRIDHTGWQQEFWVPTDPGRTPAALVTDPETGEPVTVTVQVGDEDVVVQCWRVDVGRVPLFLLDTDRPENNRFSRWISERLYDSDETTRLSQYVVLGSGGVKMLSAFGIDPGVIHMNEGHAAFAALEAAAQAGAGSFDDRIASVRGRTVFTTHTPVPAGNDTYPADMIAKIVGPLAQRAGTDVERVLRLGRTHPDDPNEPFGVTQFALRTSRNANGVSERHGGVSRGMWQALWPERSVDDVPIGHVTNGVHVLSWVGAPMRRLLDRYIGEGWAGRALDPSAFEGIDDIPDEELWAVRCEQRRLLIEFVRDRSQLDRISRGEPREYVQAGAAALDPNVLTVGFARRLATYKRMGLLLHDLHRSLALVRSDRPIQLLIAGKAHPRDDDGKRLVQTLFGSRWEEGVAGRVIFLEDYELGMASRLVRGCDVWVNLPRPPLEASGTSGMKSAVNGGLQLSVLDGWWSEGFDPSYGWGLSGEEEYDHGAQDHRHADELYRALENDIVPEFYSRDGDLPREWLARVRRSMKALIPRFSATRMISEYEARVYRASSG